MAQRAILRRERYQLYRQVKGLFDPAGILNLGQVVNASPMTQDLRCGADYRGAAAT